MPLSETLKKRRRSKGKSFIRQQWWYKPSLGATLTWRKPRGHQSKVRKSKKGYPPLVRGGYASPESTRGMVNGKHTVIVNNPSDLEMIDISKGQVAILASGMGKLKALKVAKLAEEKNIPILNKRKVARAKHNIHAIEQKKKAKAEEAAKVKAEEVKKAAEKKAAEEKKKAVAAEKKPAAAEKKTAEAKPKQPETKKTEPAAATKGSSKPTEEKK